jgi:hypothetical protein
MSGGRHPRSWLTPGAQSTWWNAEEDSSVVIDQANPPAVPEPPAPTQGQRQPPKKSVFSFGQPTGIVTQDSWWAVLTDLAQSIYHLWKHVRPGEKRTMTVVAFLVIALSLSLGLILYYQQGLNQARHAPPIAAARPSATPLPTATPQQTELDGVITIQNLDGQNAFAGDIQITADNGHYFCRNAPEPKSTWHIILDPGQTTSVPCAVPVSTPSNLPAHTFTAVVTGTNGMGRALVDNPAPFLPPYPGTPTA